MRRVHERRRIVMRVGFAALFIVSATACIFDKGGDYQGGGRLDRGATAKTAEPEPTVTDTVPTSTTNPPVDSSTGIDVNTSD
jgi:hypothetical protein